MYLGHMLFTPLDYYSIIEKLGEIEWRHSEEKEPSFYDYADLFYEMSIGASNLYHDLESLVNSLEFTYDLPIKRRSEVEDYTGISWFNTAASLISATNMEILLENEGVFNPYDENTARDKRIRAIMLLKKEQIKELLTEVFHFIMLYLRLISAYEAICGLVDELEFLHSPWRNKQDEIALPPSAYLN